MYETVYTASTFPKQSSIPLVARTEKERITENAVLLHCGMGFASRNSSYAAGLLGATEDEVKVIAERDCEICEDLCLMYRGL